MKQKRIPRIQPHGIQVATQTEHTHTQTIHSISLHSHTHHTTQTARTHTITGTQHPDTQTPRHPDTRHWTHAHSTHTHTPLTHSKPDTHSLQSSRGYSRVGPAAAHDTWAAHRSAACESARRRRDDNTRRSTCRRLTGQYANMGQGRGGRGAGG